MKRKQRLGFEAWVVLVAGALVVAACSRGRLAGLREKIAERPKGGTEGTERAVEQGKPYPNDGAEGAVEQDGSEFGDWERVRVPRVGPEFSPVDRDTSETRFERLAPLEA